MRIITGSAKGTKLKPPKGLSTRPTGDRVKESLFNILGFQLNETRVLDLFAGTGNLGLEALSRGAHSALFVDQDMQSINLIKENAQLTKLVEKTQIYKGEVLRTIDGLANTMQKFDLIFCDPPYNKGLVNRVLDKLDTTRILSDEGIIIMEHSRHELVADQWKHLHCFRRERYGETTLSFLSYKQEVK